VSLAALVAASGPGVQGPRVEQPRAWSLETAERVSARSRRTLDDLAWWGGTYTAATGERVTVHVSATYPHDEAVAQRWADYLASLVHGQELGLLTATLATPGEVQDVCGDGALGCYADDKLVAVGEASDGIDPTAVVAHEYGHHVASHRSNAPWNATEWGTKRWASYAQVCSRAAAGTVFPGDEGAHYPLNAGEAFAETYRVLNQASGSFDWPLVDPSFRPDEAALAAVRDDVLNPWTGPSTRTVRLRFAGRSRTLTTTVSTPLDGDLHVVLRSPLAAAYSLTVDAGGAAHAAGTLVGGSEKELDLRICGQRSLTLHVTRVAQAPPSARLTITEPAE
jgi:hypothetical protein